MSDNFEVVDQIPTLGDLCDSLLVTGQGDPFAAARLLKRWLEPELTSEALRDLPVTDMSEHITRIIAAIREHSAVLTTAYSRTLTKQ